MSDAISDHPDPNEPPDGAGSLIDAVPGLLRITGGFWLRGAEWTLSAWTGAGSRLVRAAVSGESAAQLMADAEAEVREYARRLLGLTGGEERGQHSANGNRPGPAPTSAETLRERGAELLRQSADVSYNVEAHPAYVRILEELAPDEGRILRLLVTDGAQAAVDVRSSQTLNVSSQLVAPGITMIGARAGCRYVESVPGYLNNLYRLGLIWFSRESLADHSRYQVLEAQPDVLAALRRSKGRGRLSRTVRRSIHLTPFGDDFCRICLPLDTGEIEALPGGAAPGGAASGGSADGGVAPGGSADPG